MLSADQKSKYEQIRQTALSELESLDREIESELSRVKKRLLELQEDKKAVKQILDGASARLGTSVPGALKEINLSELNRQVDAVSEPGPTPPPPAARRGADGKPLAFGASPRAGE